MTKKSGSWGGAIASLVAWWAWIPALLGIAWLIMHGLFGGFGVANESWALFWNNNILHQGIVFWMYGLIGLVGSAIIAGVWAAEGLSKGLGWVSAVFGILAVLAFGQIVHYSWNSDKNVQRYYNSATTFYTPSATNYPPELKALLSNAHRSSTGCYVSNTSDVNNCVRVGTMPKAGFVARTSSATGAILAMQRTSGTTQNVDLLTTTLVYLQGKNEWSAIRDGSGNTAHIEGVVTWKGDGTPHECYFTGTDQLNKAIKGAHTNSLSNMLAKAYPNLYWTMRDVYGFCTRSHPVLAFLMRQQTTYLNRTLTAPGGVVLVRGSSSGQPVFTYEAHPLDLPGPSYPQTIANKQLAANTWAAGRSDEAHGIFGFEPGTTGNQFLLKSRADGHTYWVTPLTLNSSQSQLYVAYAMVRADTVRAGELNPMRIYVLANNDIRRINVTQLDASAKDYMAQQVPGFASNGGKLVDYTPVTGDVWRVFAEINGRVVYRLDISASNAIQPNLVSLDNFAGTTPTSQQPSNQQCGTPLSQLSQAQIEKCIQQFAGALNGAG